MPWLAHAKVLTVFIIDDTACLMAIEVSRTNDEIGHIEGQETVAIETTRISLRQHESFADNALGINMTEIGTREEAIVTT